jgi:hypothetical protein
MIYLTDAHHAPPAHILADGLHHPVAPLIRREDIHRLAALGVLRHVTPSDEAPLGYTDWHLAEDADGYYYTREPAGTPEARAAESARLAAEAERLAAEAAVAARAAERQAKVLPMVERIAKETLAPKVVAGEASEEEISELAALGLFPDWAPGVAYTSDPKTVLTYDGTLIEVILSHTSQADWLPEDVPNLYKIHRPAGSVAAWVQPLGAQDAYALGERVTHDRPQMSGAIWVFESKINANTTEPGRDGTFDRWWLPVEAV